MLDGNIDDIEEWSAMFDHMVGDTAKVPKVRPRNMRDNPFDENGYLHATQFNLNSNHFKPLDSFEICSIIITPPPIGHNIFSH